MDLFTPETALQKVLTQTDNHTFKTHVHTHKAPRLLLIGTNAQVFHSLARTCKVHGWQQQWQKKIQHKDIARKIDKIDIVVVHVGASECNHTGESLLQTFKQKSPSVKVIAIVQDPEWMLAALRAGADDCLSIQQTQLIFQACKKQLLGSNSHQGQQELAKHFDYFKAHDKHASHLLKSLMPKTEQTLGTFKIECHCGALNLIPLFYLLDEQLLMLTIHAPNREQTTAFGILTIQALMNYLCHQYKTQENRILSQPDKTLSFLNWHLCESGLKQLFHMSSLIFNPHEKQMTLANGGFTHPHWRKHVHDLPIGIMRHATYTQRKLPLTEKQWTVNMPHLGSQKTSVTIDHV